MSQATVTVPERAELSEPHGGTLADAIAAAGAVAAAPSDLDREALLRLIARKMCDLVDVSRCSLFLREQNGHLYRGQASYGIDNDGFPVVKDVLSGSGADEFTREVVRSRAPVVIQDALHDPRAVRSVMRTWRVRSMMGVPMVLRDEVVGVLFLDSAEETRHFSERDQDLATAFAGLAAAALAQNDLLAELRQSSDSAALQNKALRRAAAVDDRLTELVTTGGSLRGIAQTVTELTKKHCAIFDPELLLLATDGEDGGFASLKQTVLSREQLDAVPTDRPSMIGPFPAAGFYKRLLVAPVMVRDDRWASLVLLEEGSAFTAFDRLISRRAARVVAFEISAENRATRAEWDARTSLAADLVRGNRDVADVERRANYLGLQLDQAHVLCLLSRRGDEPDPPAPRPDAEAFATEISPDAEDFAIFGTGVPEGIALITALPEDRSNRDAVEELKARLIAACEALDPGGEWTAGISTPCRNASDYVRAYHQTRQVVSCIDVYCPPTGTSVLSADDLGPTLVLLAGSDPAETHRFAEYTLGTLLAGEGPPELVETLVCFFENARSIRRTARVLGFHENTIRNRLAKVEELTGFDVATDSDAQLSFQIALLVLRLQGTLPARAKVAEA